VPAEARPGHGVFTRWRAWLQGRATDHTAGEREETTTPAARDDHVEHVPAPSLDDVLRDAAQQRGPRDDREAGSTES
jgi:hypothetical protein